MAQLAAHRFCNPEVAGSIPVRSSTRHEGRITTTKIELLELLLDVAYTAHDVGWVACRGEDKYIDIQIKSREKLVDAYTRISALISLQD